MFRAILLRNSRAITRTRASFPISRQAVSFVRLQSTQAPADNKPRTPEQEARKASLKKADDLQRDWDAKILSYEDLRPKTESPSPDSYLIDVREPDEVIQGMIPSAVNLPLSVLANALHLNEAAFLEKYGFNKPKKDQELVFYCRSGMRSTTASDVAKRNGYTNILNYKGSWLEWTERESKKAS
ncbi:hypothetical protein AX16_005498 [Volvariella volvacea WC 439]|nr:hypothetical protein AX16_005498 [Volvariella volvacea WC 439]